MVAASAGGLVVGFGLLWAAVLESQQANCKPPTCATADPSTDVLYALAFLAPVIAVGSVEIGIRALLLRHRPSSSRALDRRVSVIRRQALGWRGTIPEVHISAFEQPGRGGLRSRSSSNKGKGDGCRHCQGRGPINEAAESDDLRDSLQQA